MKKLVFTLFIALLYGQHLWSQKSGDVGLFVAATTYLGDLNPIVPYKSPSYAIGGIYRISLNKRYCLRASLINAKLKGSDADLNYPQFRGGSFNTNLLDIALQFEFNFLSYQTYKKKFDHTPYLSAGIGDAIIMSSNIDARGSFITIPFGTGYKITLSRRLSAGMELSFRKTFNDTIDGYQTLTNGPNVSKLFNNDWYSFLGIFITYKFFNFAEECPVYLNY